ncbi:MAG TPA: peptidylprolyl isomerase [Chlorobaculum parvum]|uniref:Peptidylprolyl isomerase n=1 Tax=Chlorobaculum parvum TaxID=274539 RepID=A0A7C5HPS5_9CHLB|nr:peptidylprolyl isomerase [Chlorobaculum parvum]
MKKTVLALLAVLMFSVAGLSEAIASSVPDKIVAIVGREIILNSQIKEQELMYRLQYRDAKKDPDLRQKILTNMIDQKILLTKARIDSIKVDETRIDQMATAKYNALRAKFPSVSAMEERFSLPVNRLKQDIREDIMSRQMVAVLRRKQFHDVSVTYDEVMAFYRAEKDKLPEAPEMVSVSQIIRYPEIAESEKQRGLRKIEAIRQQLQNGADFATLARETSDDPGSRELGGDLGFVRKGELVPSFEKAAYALKPGQISGIVESRFGYHLIQLIDKEDQSIHVRHILAAFDRSKVDLPKTISLLESIRAKILSGKATFTQMAEQYSEDPSAKTNGGQIISSATGEPFVEFDSLRPDLQKIVGGLKHAGDISHPKKIEPERGPFFYALFRLDARQPAHRLSPERDFTKIEEMAANQKRQEAFEAWIEKLKKEVVVRIMSDI